MENQVQVFNNEEFGSVRTEIINDKPYFCGKDIAECLGYKDTAKAIKQHCLEKGVVIIPTNGGKQKMNVISEAGLLELVGKSRKATHQQKNDFIEWLKNEKLLNNNISFPSCKEIEFIDILEDVLKPFELKGIKQYKVLNYKIDYYIPKLNIAIEYDENEHKHYNQSKEQTRQKEIQNKLKCKFIRVSDKNSNSYNIGLVTKNIFNL